VDLLCKEYTRIIERQLPPEWKMSDLVQAVIGDDEALHTLLKAHYYDVMIHGPKAWLYRDLFKFLDSFYYNQL
jgi:hypothetical protein